MMYGLIVAALLALLPFIFQSQRLHALLAPRQVFQHVRQYASKSFPSHTAQDAPAMGWNL